MTTIAQLAEAVVAEVYGYTQTVDVNTYLTVAATSFDVEFTVADARNFSRGIVQVGEELILIDTVDRTNNRLTCGDISGRGIRGTTAAGHSPGVRVLMAPVIPIAQALSAVREILRSAAGLFAVDTTTFPAVAAQEGYDLPAGTDGILEVAWQPPGPSDKWIRLRRWRFDRIANQIVIGSAVMPGRSIRVAYTKPVTVPADSAEFTTSGLPESCLDVVRLGAAWKVVSFLEPYTLMPNTAAGEAMDRNKTSGNRLSVARYLYQLYQVRLSEEVAELQRRYPIHTHFGA